MVTTIDLNVHSSPEKLAKALKHSLQTDGCVFSVAIRAAAPRRSDTVCTHSFIYLVNHGMEEEAAKSFDIASDFFGNETAEEKERCSDVLNKGYSAIGEEVLDPLEHPEGDKKEAFNLAAIEGDDVQPIPLRLQPHLPHLKSFRTSLFTFCQRLLTALAIALELEPDRFTKFHDDSIFAPILRFLHYPALPGGAKLANANRAAAHSDYGSCTLLFVHGEGGEGLQLLPESERVAGGKWRDVPVVKNAVLCNIGDALELWSGAQYKSTMHRVQLPEIVPPEGIPARYSIAFFNQPIPTTSLKTLVPVSSISDIDLERMERKGVKPGTEISAGAHLQARLDATYKMRSAERTAAPVIA